MTRQAEIPESITVCVLGAADTGKTTLIKRLVNDRFELNLAATVGADFSRLVIDEESGARLDIWDTAGGLSFAGMMPYFLQKSKVVMLVVDPTAADFEDQLIYLNSILVTSKGCFEQFKFLLVATKSDLVTDELKPSVETNIEKFQRQFAMLNPLSFMHISAKDNNVMARAALLAKLTSQIVTRVITRGEKTISEALDQGIFARLSTVESRLSKRFFKPDASRSTAIEKLRSSLEKCRDKTEVIASLIIAARFLRSPDKQGRLRYGMTLSSSCFKFSAHFGSYEHSEFYQFIKRELKTVAPDLDLALESKPAPSRSVLSI